MRALITLALLAIPNLLHATCAQTALFVPPQQLIVAPGQKTNVEGLVESRFVGPVDLRVWRHWQPSWNVENLTTEPQFELIRGIGGDHGAYVLLRVRRTDGPLTAHLFGAALVRKGDWEMETRDIPPRALSGTPVDGWTEFVFRASGEFFDINERRLVTRISFVVEREGERVFAYDLAPMFARGKNQASWNNPIPAYSAHGGSGAINVATLFDQSKGWDNWMGTPVAPRLAYFERNTLQAGAIINLHRHEANQEIWLVDEGAFVVMNGVAARASDTYQTERRWDESGARQMTDEFKANGGWIETRPVLPSDFTVIVPNAQQINTVFFHGIRAVTDGAFFTLGEKN